MKQKIKELVKCKNFWRAAVIYVASLTLGIIGWLTLGDIGDYALTCIPGLGSGIAIAFLSNGHKKPVTVKSFLTSVLMITVITAGCWAVGIPIQAALLGAALGFAGSCGGFWFINRESQKLPVDSHQKQ